MAQSATAEVKKILGNAARMISSEAGPKYTADYLTGFLRHGKVWMPMLVAEKKWGIGEISAFTGDIADVIGLCVTEPPDIWLATSKLVAIGSGI